MPVIGPEGKQPREGGLKNQFDTSLHYARVAQELLQSPKSGDPAAWRNIGFVPAETIAAYARTQQLHGKGNHHFPIYDRVTDAVKTHNTFSSFPGEVLINGVESLPTSHNIHNLSREAFKPIVEVAQFLLGADMLARILDIGMNKIPHSDEKMRTVGEKIQEYTEKLLDVATREGAVIPGGHIDPQWIIRKIRSGSLSIELSAIDMRSEQERRKDAERQQAGEARRAKIRALLGDDPTQYAVRLRSAGHIIPSGRTDYVQLAGEIVEAEKEALEKSGQIHIAIRHAEQEAAEQARKASVTNIEHALGDISLYPGMSNEQLAIGLTNWGNRVLIVEQRKDGTFFARFIQHEPHEAIPHPGVVTVRFLSGVMLQFGLGELPVESSHT